MKPGRKPREKVAIEVRTKTHERLAIAAQRSGEKVGTLLDGILAKWLDEHDKETN